MVNNSGPNSEFTVFDGDLGDYRSEKAAELMWYLKSGRRDEAFRVFMARGCGIGVDEMVEYERDYDGIRFR